MKKTSFRLLALFAILLTSESIAGEGHDHSHDTASVRPKISGAQIKGNEAMYVEVLYQDKNIKFYPFTKEQNPMPLDQAKFTVQLELPRKKELQPLKVTKHNDHFMAAFDPKGLHRFTLVVTMEDEHRDTFKYTFEPKK
jgi:hypothetical protein